MQEAKRERETISEGGRDAYVIYFSGKQNSRQT